MDLQEWRRIGKRYMQYCGNGGRGCRLMAAFSRKIPPGKKFLADVRGNALLGGKN